MGQKSLQSGTVGLRWSLNCQPNGWKSSYQMGWGLTWRHWWRSTRASHWWCQNSKSVRLCRAFYFSASDTCGMTLILKDCPHILGFPCIPSSDGRLIPSHSSRLFGVTFCNIYLTLGGKISLFIRASVIRLGPLEKVQENIFIVWPIIISGVSLLFSNVADLHSPEIIEYRLWSAIGWLHYVLKLSFSSLCARKCFCKYR